MGRIEILDGLRGWCLVFMMITHLHINGDFLLGYLHFNELILADSAQAFIFLSGLLVGIIGVRQHGRDGAAPVARRFWRRALELYGWHLGLLTALLTLTRLAPEGWFAWRDWLQHLLVQGDSYLAATAVLLYQPTYLDILPQYIVYLLAAPAVIHLIGTGRAGLVLAFSIGLWLAVQIGLDAPLAAWLQATVRFSGQSVTLRAAFNPMAWQLLFVSGLVVGGLLARGELDAKRLLSPRCSLLLELVLGLLAVSLAFRMALHLGLEDTAWLADIRPFADRQDLGLLRVMSFAGLAFLTAWALAAAPRSTRPGVRRIGVAARSMLGHPWVAIVGRHSLPVFAFHVVLIYLLRYVDAQAGGIPDPWYSLLAVAAIFSLGLPAMLLELRRRPKATLAPARG
jgi:hypothetical protein